jgi:hypothetical protein
VRIERVEAAIAAYYGTVQLPPDEVARLRAFLGQELTKLRCDADRERGVQEGRLRKLQGEREKLLQAHYADAITLDLLKREQDRITTAMAAVEGRLAAIAADFKTAETNLHRALDRAGDCQAAYREASDRMRRQFNLAFFKRLLIHDEGTVSGELAEPWDVILGEELRRAAATREAEGLKDTIERAERENARRPREPEPVLVGATAVAPDWGDGWSPKILVRMRGLEPPRPYGHGDLNAARLPIPPHPRVGDATISHRACTQVGDPLAGNRRPPVAVARLRHRRSTSRFASLDGD